jgi:hypothetical protein
MAITVTGVEPNGKKELSGGKICTLVTFEQLSVMLKLGYFTVLPQTPGSAGKINVFGH